MIPVCGGLFVGLMARFGSEQTRGHGIPEAMERILINGSSVPPRLGVGYDSIHAERLLTLRGIAARAGVYP